MKKTEIKPVAWVSIALTLYLVSYGFLRTSGALTNVYSHIYPGNGIRAHRMEWRDISLKLAADKSMVLGAVEYLRGRVPEVLEAVYWPLRELEVAFWQATGRYEDSHSR